MTGTGHPSCLEIVSLLQRTLRLQGLTWVVNALINSRWFVLLDPVAGVLIHDTSG